MYVTWDLTKTTSRFSVIIAYSAWGGRDAVCWWSGEELHDLLVLIFLVILAK